MVELCSNDTAVAVWSGDLAPDASDFRSLSFSGGSVDEGYTLSKVKLCGFGVIDTLDLEQRCVWVRVSLSTLVRKVLALNVESVALGGSHVGC